MNKQELGKAFKKEFYASSDADIETMVEITNKAAKELMLSLVGHDAQGVQIVEPEDYTSEEHYDKGYNDAKEEIRKKVSEL